MKRELINQPHTLTLLLGRVVIRTMGDLSLRSLILEAFNKTKTEEVQLFLGGKKVWDVEFDEAMSNYFDKELVEMMSELDILFDANNELKTDIRLVGVVDIPEEEEGPKA